MALVCMMMATMMISLGRVTANPPGGDQPTGGQPGVPGPFPTAGPPGPRPDANPSVREAPPLANLRVRSLRADRENVTVGNLVTFRAEVENVGYRLARTANVTIYAPVGGIGTAVDWQEVDLWYFEGVVWMTWSPPAPGTYVVRAYADADFAVPETNETDNEASMTLTVVATGTAGAPDLRVTETSLGVPSAPFAGSSVNLRVRVRNVGTAVAVNVTVHVLDRQDDQAPMDVGVYVIPSIAAGGADTHVLPWTFAGDGPHRVITVVDENGVIRELREDNNVASTGIHVRNAAQSACSPGNLGEHTVPFGVTETYTNCVVQVANLTVFGTFRLTGTALLLVGKYYLPRDSIGLPAPNGTVGDAHEIRVRAGGSFLVEGTSFQGATVTGAMSPYAFKFQADVGSAVEWTHARAYFPWGPPGVVLQSCTPVVSSEDCDMQWPGGLVVRTSSFAFFDSVVAYGRSHGLYLESTPGGPACAICGITIIGGTFRDNQGAGIALVAGGDFPPIDRQLEVAVENSTLLRNKAGLFQFGRSAGSLAHAWMNFTMAQENVLGVESDKRSLFDALTDTFEHNTLASVRLMSLDGETRVDVLQETLLASLPEEFGLYAWRASPIVLLNEFRVDGSAPLLDPGVRADIVLDSSIWVPEPQGWCCGAPWVSQNDFTHQASGWRDYVAVVHDTRVRAEGNSVRMAKFGSVYCLHSTCDVEGNQFGFSAGPSPGLICQGVAAVANSTLTLEDNTFEHSGCGWDLWSVLVRNSTAWMQSNPLVLGLTVAWDSSALDIRNNGPTGGIWIERCPGANILDNVIHGKTTLTASSDVQFLRNTVSESTWGIELDDSSRNVLIEGNDMTSSVFYPPGQPPNQLQADKAHIAVYTNSSATIVRNVLRKGAWGISLDDIRPNNVPLWRGTYAYIEGNWIEDNGFVGIGVDATTRADIVGNSLNRSNGWAIQVESGNETVGNTVIGNWVNDTYGYNRGGCDWTALWLSSENFGAGHWGSVEVAWNRILRTNGTGIRYCEQKNVYIHNNTIDNTGSNHNVTGITLQGFPLDGVGIPARVENNTVRGFYYGVWVKHSSALDPAKPGHELGRNTIEDNTEGVQIGWGDAANAYSWAQLRNNVIRDNGIGVNVSSALFGSDLYVGRATLRGNILTNNTVAGVLVRSFVEADHAVRAPWADLAGNTVNGSPYGLYLRGSVMPTAGVYSVWADLHDNNTVANNTYGVWIHGPTVDLVQFRLWWNDVRDNTNQGVHVEGDPGGGVYFHAECNWWNSAGGPYDLSPGLPDQNNNPTGQPVSDYFHYRDEVPPPPPQAQRWWLDSPASIETECTPAP